MTRYTIQAMNKYLNSNDESKHCNDNNCKKQQISCLNSNAMNFSHAHCVTLLENVNKNFELVRMDLMES